MTTKSNSTVGKASTTKEKNLTVQKGNIPMAAKIVDPNIKAGVKSKHGNIIKTN